MTGIRNQGWDISEILQQVLGLAGRSTRASAARICKYWSQIALDSLWEELDSLMPLLSLLLGPLRNNGSSGHYYWVRGFHQALQTFI